MEARTETPPRLYPIRYQPLLYLSVPFLAGIATGDQFTGSSRWIAGGSVLLAGIVIMLLAPRLRWLGGYRQWVNRHLPLSPAWLLIALAAGILRIGMAHPTVRPDHLAYYNQRGTAEIIGTITDSPQEDEHSTRFVLEAESIQQPPGGGHSPWLEIDGKALVIAQGTLDLRYGQRVSVYCGPTTPEILGDFNYPRWLAARGIHTQCMFASVYPLEGKGGNWLLRGIFSLRRLSDQRITGYLPPQEAALLSGILLGLENEIPAETERAFQRSGTSHIIAISGANFSLLVSFATAFFLRSLPRRWSLPAIIVLIVLYTIFVGGNPAVIRAAFMGVMTFSARFIGRKNQGLNSLGFSAAALCTANPLLLWDLSFQLSALATLGLVLFAEPMQYHFTRLMLKLLPEAAALKVSGWLSEYLLMSLAAQVFTLPLIAYHFQSLSLSAILANLLVLPVQPLIMLLGAITVICGWIFTPLGQFAAWLVWVPLAYTLRVVTWIGSWSWGFWTIGRFSPTVLLTYFSLVTALPLIGGWFPILRRKITHSTLLLVASLLIVVLWNTALHQPDRQFHLDLPHLPENDAVLVRLPDGNALLLGRSAAIDSLEHAVSPLISGYHLQVIVCGTSGKSSLDSLDELLLRYQPEVFWYSPLLPETAVAELMDQTQPTGAASTSLVPGQVMKIGEDFQLSVLAVRPEGTALLLEYQQLQVLIPGGISQSVLRQLVPVSTTYGTVLVLTHRDLVSADVDEWYQQSFQAIMVSGEDQNCPAAHCRTTAVYGSLELVSDGSSFWLSSQ
ncbi:MAG: ComEC family competence protein [Anaerolineae bacterium]|nr:ComEC family competence protein [Anaerolineae bacterium]